jgi:hypothetical protein
VAIDSASDFDAIVDGGDFSTLTTAYAQANGTTTNTKSISGVIRIGLGRDPGSGLGLTRCAFLVKASAFTSGFSIESPVTPRAGDLVTVSGESTPWTVQAASLRGAGAYYRLDATIEREGWDS